MLRFRIWPETEVGLTLHGKKPGAGWAPEVARPRVRRSSPGSDMRPYDRLIGAALDRRALAVRPAGDGRGRLAGGRPDPRRRGPGAAVPEGHLGPEGGRPAAARRRTPGTTPPAEPMDDHRPHPPARGDRRRRLRRPVRGPGASTTARSRSPSSTAPRTTCSSRCSTSAPPACCPRGRSRCPLREPAQAATTTSTACWPR